MGENYGGRRTKNRREDVKNRWIAAAVSSTIVGCNLDRVYFYHLKVYHLSIAT